MKLKLVLVIIWMSLIFCLSNQPSDDSSKLSNGFINKTIINIYEVFNPNITSKDKEIILEKYSMPVRKLAHYIVYLILGVLVYICLNGYNINKIIIYSIAICFIYATSDEIHQYFVIGRYCSIIDILIDSIGSITGITILNNIIKFKKINKNI